MYTYQTEENVGAERERLILEHLPQVRLIARRIYERLPENVSLDDLISTGVIGLIAAVDHFDPAQGVQLKTYAEHKIRGAILDSLREMDWAPKNKRRRAKQIEAAIKTVEQRLGRVPGEDEIIPDSEENLPSTTLERAELERLLAQAIEQMPKMERTVLSLYYHEEATLREIAEIMQMHLSRIAQLKAQGILRLRTYMERRWSAQR